MLDWDFLGLRPSRVEPLDRIGQGRITDGPGIYVLIASDMIAYAYPKGSSPIFYIGLATNLRRRLSQHRRRTRRVLRGTAGGVDWPRYEYGAAHGCTVAAFPADTATSEEIRSVESDVIALFAARFGAPPIANGAANPKSVLRRSAEAPPVALTDRPWFHDEPRGANIGARRSVRPSEQSPRNPLVDSILALAHSFDRQLTLSERANYIGFVKDGRAYNFAKCRPRGSLIRLDIVLPFSDARMQSLQRATLPGLRYDTHLGAYVSTLSASDLAMHEELLTATLRDAHRARGA